MSYATTHLRTFAIAILCALAINKATAQLCPVASGLSATNITATTATLNWTDDPNNKYYAVRWREDLGGGLFGPISYKAVYVNSYTVAGLNRNANYQFAVKVFCNDHNHPPYSAWSSFSTLAAFTNNCDLLPISSLMVDSVTSTQAWVSWPAQSDRRYYGVQLRQDLGGGLYDTLVKKVTYFNHYAFTGLMATTNYEYRLYVACDGGVKPGWTGWKPFSTNIQNPTTCVPAFNLSAVNITGTGAELTWQADPYYNYYSVQWREDLGGGSFGPTDHVTVFKNSYIVAGLKTNSNYEFHVKTMCSDQNHQPFSAWSPFTTLPFLTYECDLLPASLLNVDSVHATEAWVSWPPQANRTYYGVQLREDLGGGAYNTNTPYVSYFDNYHFTGLTASANYEYRLYVICEEGVQPGWTDWKAFSTPAFKMAQGGAIAQAAVGVKTKVEAMDAELESEIALETAPADLAPATQLLAFPNPSTGVFQLEWTGAVEKIVVRDAVGRLVREIAVAEGAEGLALDLTDQARGVYSLQAGAATARLVVK